MRALRHAVKSIKNPEMKTREDGKTKNARENENEIFVVPRYLSRRVFGNQWNQLFGTAIGALSPGLQGDSNCVRTADAIQGGKKDDTNF